MSDQRGGHGGEREGAGRPRARWRSDPPHRAREDLDVGTPVHVTLRARCHVPELRTPRILDAVATGVELLTKREDPRVVHTSLQRNHLHLLVERGERPLARSMCGFVPMLAKAINAATGHAGSVFEHRYHTRAIETPRQARNAISYVLNNWRRHEEDLKTPAAFGVALDPCASGDAFDGWLEHISVAPSALGAVVSRPRSPLLSSSWRVFGLISCFEVPGPLR